MHELSMATAVKMTSPLSVYATTPPSVGKHTELHQMNALVFVMQYNTYIYFY